MFGSAYSEYIDVIMGLGADMAFTYRVPEHLRAKAAPGHRVVVPLGRGVRTGIIAGPAADPSVSARPFKVKDAIEIPDDGPLVPGEVMELTRWVSSYYHAPWGMALALALVPGLEEGKPARPRRGVEEEYAPWAGPKDAVTPNVAQIKALKKVTDGLAEGGFRPFLLHGATGSGKTEVYLRAIERLKGSGGGAIVLVPEISLTPQLVRRFKARFGESVAVMHSGLTDAQRRSEWRRIRSGEAAVAVGARSAVFAPFDKTGIIIVDEEHDGSYKQEEGVRYHARDVAVMRARNAGCPVVLGSATPSLESYYNALEGKYAMLELPERVAGRPMPAVELIDTRQLPAGTTLSPPLVNAAAECIEKGEQALFFMNRRGFSDFLLCRDCGAVPGCPSCSISLTYHKRDKRLSCHWCGSDYVPGAVCPSCGGDKIKYVGGGTEKVEADIEKLFDGVKITRMDRDTVKGRGAYAKLLDEVNSGSSGVLIGTQMVAKGHDLPGIGLVGVVMADYGLHMPDFRAAERVFQVVTQVAGRSGRGDTPGRVMVQTYSPEHYSIVHAASHDYKGFYDEEIAFRKELGYPPFSRLALVTIKGVKDDRASSCADAAKSHFSRAAKGKGVEVMGPAPAPVKRLRGKYRYRLILKSKNAAKLHAVIEAGVKSLAEKRALPACSIDVDVDPQSMV